MSTLEKQPEGFKLWVQVKILSLGKPFAINYVRLKESDAMGLDENVGMTFSFDMPEVGENEGVFVTVGFKSLEGEKVVEDLGMNGYVVVGF